MEINIQTLEAQIEECLKAWKIVGGAVSIVQDGIVLSSRGYGLRNADTKEPVDKDTVFGIGSNTKSFTAAALAKFVDEKKLEWDDPIIKYLPDFQLSDPWITKHITVRDMLCHRSGLGRSMRILYNHDFDLAETIRRMRYMPFILPFRDAFGYNNYHFMVAGRVVEVLSGKTWPQYMKEDIFEPLEMHRTGADLSQLVGLTNISAAHADISDHSLPHEARLFTQNQVIPWVDVGNQPAGGIFSSAADMTKWMLMLLDDGKHKGNPFLSPKVIEDMTLAVSTFKNPLQSDLGFLAAMQPEINFYTYGLGWYVLDYKGRKMFFHGGQIHGFWSMVVFFPQENLAYTILVNAHYTLVHGALTFLIADAFLGGSQRPWSEELLGVANAIIDGAKAQVDKRIKTRKTGTTPTLPLSAYVGTFENDFVGQTHVTLSGQQLEMKYGTAFKGGLMHWEDDLFLAQWEDKTFNPNWVQFNLSTNGRVDSLTVQDEGTFKKLA